MLKPFLLVGLSSLPLLASAQTTSTAPQFYAGIGASFLTARPFHSYGSLQAGPALTAGFQFTPHLALQLSGSYHWDNQTYSSSYYDANGVATYQDTDINSKLVSFPLLLRATLTDPASRWRVDALGGAVLQFSTYSRTNIITSANGVSIDQFKYSGSTVSLLLGPGVRYALRPQVDLVLSTLVSLNLQSGYYDFSSRLTSNISTGINFNFGR